MTRVDWLAVWILFSVWCSLSGWTLSALGSLNLVGVGVSTVLFLLALAAVRQPLELAQAVPRRVRNPLRSRWLLPRIWLLLAGLELVGGLLYAPNNFDYLTYRFPRVLYWCWDQQWHWISTANVRMNLSGTQFEWMMAPLFIFFKTDRLFFLINFISYLFLPGLVYSVFCGLGISRRISWWWMWVLPGGYCFVLQAGSAGNDSFTAVYLLAALQFIYRARHAGPVRNGVLSTLAIALMTAAKASNLPLVLPWAALLFFRRGQVLARATPLAVTLTLIAAIGASYLPMAVLNRAHTGDFFGDPTNQGQMKVNGPLGGIIGNVLQIGAGNMEPPLWYKDTSWAPAIPSFLQPLLKHSFPRLATTLAAFPVEEAAGIGLGCLAAAIVFVVLGLRARFFEQRLIAAPGREALWITAAVAVSMLVYMSKIATEAASRVVAPYYPLLIAGVLVIAALDGRVIHRRVVRWVGVLAMLSVLPAVILSPSRPLFPVGLAMEFMQKHAPVKVSEKFISSYQVYALRAYCFQDVTALLPSDARVVGFLQDGDAPEVSLWRPFGSRKMVDITAKDSAPDLKARGIHFLVVSQYALTYDEHTDIQAVLSQWSAHLVAEKQLILKAHQGNETWYVLSLD